MEKMINTKGKEKKKRENMARSVKEGRKVEASARCFPRRDWSIRLVSFIPGTTSLVVLLLLLRGRRRLAPPSRNLSLVLSLSLSFAAGGVEDFHPSETCKSKKEEKLAKKCWIGDNLATALVHNSIRSLSLSLSKTLGTRSSCWSRKSISSPRENLSVGIGDGSLH